MTDEIKNAENIAEVMTEAVSTGVEESNGSIKRALIVVGVLGAAGGCYLVYKKVIKPKRDQRKNEATVVDTEVVADDNVVELNKEAK